MLLVRKSILVDAPVEKVFRYLADFERHPEWVNKLVSIRKTSPGPVGVGSTFETRSMERRGPSQTLGGELVEVPGEIEVTQFVANKRFVFEVMTQEWGSGRFRHSFELRQAIIDFDKAIDLNPSYAEAYNSRGSAYFEVGDFGQAIADYNRAIEMNPDFGGAYANRGLAYANLGDVDQAIADLEKAISLISDPELISELEGIIAELKR